jgi:hypothetical protein
MYVALDNLDWNPSDLDFDLRGTSFASDCHALMKEAGGTVLSPMNITQLIGSDMQRSNIIKMLERKKAAAAAAADGEAAAASEEMPDVEDDGAEEPAYA